MSRNEDYQNLLSSIEVEIMRYLQFKEQGDNIQLQHSADELTTFLSLVRSIVNYEHEPDKRNMLSTLSIILNTVLNDVDPSSPVSDRTEVCPVAPTSVLHNGGVGRPTLAVNLQMVQRLCSIGLSWAKISMHISVSRTTLKRRRAELPAERTMDDRHLYETIHQCKSNNSTCGARYIHGHISSLGFRVTRCRIREALRRVDPHGTIVNRRLRICIIPIHYGTWMVTPSWSISVTVQYE
nr:PREDICTED: uncharacterized protein LOC109031714 isoform X1 [Bemisia tabaci]